MLVLTVNDSLSSNCWFFFRYWLSLLHQLRSNPKMKNRYHWHQKTFNKFEIFRQTSRQLWLDKVSPDKTSPDVASFTNVADVSLNHTSSSKTCSKTSATTEGQKTNRLTSKTVERQLASFRFRRTLKFVTIRWRKSAKRRVPVVRNFVNPTNNFGVRMITRLEKLMNVQFRF